MYTHQKALTEPARNPTTMALRNAAILNLRLNEGATDVEIAARLQVGEIVVRKVLRSFAISAGRMPDAVKLFREHEASLLDSVRHEIVKTATKREKLKRASLHNLAFAYEKFLVGSRLIRGETTENIGLKAALVLEAHGQRPTEETIDVEATPDPDPLTLAKAQAREIAKTLPRRHSRRLPAPDGTMAPKKRRGRPRAVLGELDANDDSTKQKRPL